MNFDIIKKNSIKYINFPDDIKHYYNKNKIPYVIFIVIPTQYEKLICVYTKTRKYNK